MSRVCELTGTKPMFGNNVSNSNVKTRRRQLPNLHKKRYFIPELKKSVTVNLSSRAIRTVDKLGGLAPALIKAKEEVLSLSLARIRRELRK
ncbi:MAG: 50S ribosomal protein L28 [Bdellovibrionales bacterium]|nr:50S ribosomal protein L28 [Bdellovibrionales bacterium]